MQLSKEWEMSYCTWDVQIKTWRHQTEKVNQMQKLTKQSRMCSTFACFFNKCRLIAETRDLKVTRLWLDSLLFYKWQAQSVTWDVSWWKGQSWETQEWNNDSCEMKEKVFLKEMMMKRELKKYSLSCDSSWFIEVISSWSVLSFRKMI